MESVNVLVSKVGDSAAGRWVGDSHTPGVEEIRQGMKYEARGGESNLGASRLIHHPSSVLMEADVDDPSGVLMDAGPEYGACLASSASGVGLPLGVFRRHFQQS